MTTASADAGGYRGGVSTDAPRPLTYPVAGMSRPGADPPAGFRVGDRRVRLGAGDDVWARAAALVDGWAVKKGTGFAVSPDDARVEAGRDYATRFGIGALRLLEPVCVVWITDEADRRGFGYGTLPGHPLRGEECFLVERDPDGSVWFRTRTVSRVSGAWWPLWAGIRLIQPLMQRGYARSAAALAARAERSTQAPAQASAGEPDALPGFRSTRRALVGDEPDRVGGIARLGYGMGGPAGPFDAPPEEPVELDERDLPWELRG